MIINFEDKKKNKKIFEKEEDMRQFKQESMNIYGIEISKTTKVVDYYKEEIGVYKQHIMMRRKMAMATTDEVEINKHNEFIAYCKERIEICENEIDKMESDMDFYREMIDKHRNK
ncbi:MAG: hypothetical protein ACRC0S_05120 [Fusobacteriaceae bacterium]